MKKKRIVSLLLCCSLLFAMTAMSPFDTIAQTIETETMPVEELSALELSIIENANYIDPDVLMENGYMGRQIRSHKEDLGIVDNGDVAPAAIPGIDYFYTHEMAVPIVVQENGDFCAPATILQNLEHISIYDFDQTQTQVATAIKMYIGKDGRWTGATSTQMTAYMNRIINENNYSPYNYAPINIHDSSFTEEFYIDTVYSNCYYYDWPAYGSFTPDSTVDSLVTGYKWPYSTGGVGHFVSYSGVEIAANYNLIMITDPNFLRRFPNAYLYDSAYWLEANVAMETMNSFIW